MYALKLRIFFSADERLVHQLITFFCSVPMCHWIFFMRYDFLPQCAYFLTYLSLLIHDRCLTKLTSSSYQQFSRRRVASSSRSKFIIRLTHISWIRLKNIFCLNFLLKVINTMIALLLLKLRWEQLEEEWTALDGMVFKMNMLNEFLMMPLFHLLPFKMACLAWEGVVHHMWHIDGKWSPPSSC